MLSVYAYDVLESFLIMLKSIECKKKINYSERKWQKMNGVVKHCRADASFMIRPPKIHLASTVLTAAKILDQFHVKKMEV